MASVLLLLLSWVSPGWAGARLPGCVAVAAYLREQAALLRQESKAPLADLLLNVKTGVPYTNARKFNQGDSNLLQHFKKHGAEVGAKSKAAYLQQAVQLAATDSHRVLTQVIGSKVIRYDLDRHWVVILDSRQALIHTHFKIDPTRAGVESELEAFLLLK